MKFRLFIPNYLFLIINNYYYLFLRLYIFLLDIWIIDNLQNFNYMNMFIIENIILSIQELFCFKNCSQIYKIWYIIMYLSANI